MPRRKSAAAITPSDAGFRESAPDVAAAPLVPQDWPHGALLNVRNNGEYYVTLFPEEYDYRHPERCLRFPNPAECQQFVSNWYARQHFDGRAG
jgi:hypothetical protein